MKEKKVIGENSKNPKDKDGNYVAQGIVEIHRKKFNQDGTEGEEITLKYLPHEKFTELVQAGDKTALEHFSFKDGIIYYATYKEVVITVNGEETSRTFELRENTMAYQAITSMSNMPANFLFSLLLESENPEWVMKVIDLLIEDSEMVLMIQDQLEIRKYTEVNYQVEKTETQELTSASYEVWDTFIEDYYTEHEWSYGTVNPPTYSFPAGEREEIITTTYENTAKAYLKKAKTWCADFEQEATLEVTETLGEEEFAEHDESEYEGLTYVLISSNENNIPSASSANSFTIIKKYLSLEKLLYTTKLDVKNYKYTENIKTEKRINYERFLGLWKNDKGEYYEECEFDPNGKLVGYELPANEGSKSYPAEVIAEENGQNINGLIGLLEMCSETEMHEEYMKYCWNKYFGEDVYDVDVDKILDYFNTDVMTNFGSSYGAISINECNLTKEEFISCVENYRTDSIYQEKFAKYAELIYDICVSKNINPILCAAVAGQESNFGKSTPGNSPFNYWGIGVTNNSSTGKTFSSMESAVEYWSDLIVSYQTPGSSYYNMIIQRSGEFSTVNSKFSGGVSNIYDIWSIYAYLGDDHQSKVYGTVNVKEYITRFLTEIECNHSLTDPTTTEEKAAYIVSYIDKGATKIAKEMFGSKAIGGDAAGVVEFAKQFVGENHSRFTSWYGVQGDWCAMFVSFCFDNSGLIPNVLPSKYASCSAEVRSLREIGKFREASSGYIPKAGDIIFYKGNGVLSGHTGIVAQCDGVNVYTIEGNTGSSSTTPYWKGSRVEAKDPLSLSSSRILRIF